VNIILGSAFRNAAGLQIERWAKQCCSLEMRLENKGHSFRMVAVEGDSIDTTINQLLDLQIAGAPLSIVTHNHGGRVFGSTEESDRLEVLSEVGNAILSSVQDDDDILIYVESDLIWTADVMIHLIGRVMNGYDVIAPMIFAGDLFYDVFVYRGLDGERFSPFPPYHRDLPREEETLVPTEVSSVGSCLVMHGEVARRCRIRDNRALLGFCKDVREKGYRIWVDKTQRIEHP
jgi:Cryptococcal mannosyltransferase 1